MMERNEAHALIDKMIPLLKQTTLPRQKVATKDGIRLSVTEAIGKTHDSFILERVGGKILWAENRTKPKKDEKKTIHGTWSKKS